MQYSDYLMITGGDIPTTHAFLGALIGGAISLIGGAAARKDAKKRDAAAAEAAKVPVVTDSTATTSHEVDLPGLISAAEASGFNPMTILNAGGLSAFTTSTAKTHSETTGQNAMAAVPTAPSMGTVFANAASTGFNIYREDAAAKTAANNAALSQYPAAPPMSAAQALGLTPAGGRTSISGSQAAFSVGPSLSQRAGSGAPMMPEIEAPKTTNPHKRFDIDPTIPGAEAYEQRYGDSELANTMAWGMTGFDDLWYNVTGKTSDERYEQYGKPLINGAKSAFDSVRSGALARESTNALGGAVWGAEKWFRQNVEDVWWPN